jgi:hypothetical protein
MKRRTKAIVDDERQAQKTGTDSPFSFVMRMPPDMPCHPIPEVPAEPTPPEGWSKGSLLNVRIYNGMYVITIYPEEYDTRHPERSLKFSNPAECQDFVSKWYARESADPRAMR